MAYANDHETRVRLVREGGSKIFENWHRNAGIGMEDFLEDLEWLDSDPCDGGDGSQMTRELGCSERDGLVRLRRVYRPFGTGYDFAGFYREDGGVIWRGCVSISCRDRI